MARGVLVGSGGGVKVGAGGGVRATDAAAACPDCDCGGDPTDPCCAVANVFGVVPENAGQRRIRVNGSVSGNQTTSGWYYFTEDIPVQLAVGDPANQQFTFTSSILQTTSNTQCLTSAGSSHGIQRIGGAGATWQPFGPPTSADTFSADDDPNLQTGGGAKSIVFEVTATNGVLATQPAGTGFQAGSLNYNASQVQWKITGAVTMYKFRNVGFTNTNDAVAWSFEIHVTRQGGYRAWATGDLGSTQYTQSTISVAPVVDGNIVTGLTVTAALKGFRPPGFIGSLQTPAKNDGLNFTATFTSNMTGCPASGSLLDAIDGALFA